jgi:hypothetical protein
MPFFSPRRLKLEFVLQVISANMRLGAYLHTTPEFWLSHDSI